MSSTGHVNHINHEQVQPGVDQEYSAMQKPGVEECYVMLHTLVWRQSPQWLLNRHKNKNSVDTEPTKHLEAMQENINPISPATFASQAAEGYQQAAKAPERVTLSDDPEQRALQLVGQAYDSAVDAPIINLDLFDRL